MNPDYEPEVEEDEISIPIESLTSERADYQAEKLAKAIISKQIDIQIQRNILKQYEMEIGRTIEYLQDGIDDLSVNLKLYLQYRLAKRPDGKKSMPLGKYTIGLRKLPDQVTIQDEDAFIAKHKCTPFVAETISYRPDLNNIKAYCKQTGEIIEGVQIEEGSEKLYVK